MKSSSIEAMLERQARFAEVRLKAQSEGGITPAAATEGPWITISRQLGSAGTELAAWLAGELDWQVFDREILTRISENTDTLETVLSWMDEQAIGPLTDYITHTLDPSVPGRVPFLQEVVKVIFGLARQGNAVILGRGANWFLEPRSGLRLRIVGPFDARVARIEEAEDCDRAAAESIVRTHDQSQQAFVQQVFKQQIDDPLGYDCTLNLGSLPVPAAGRVVISMLREKLGPV